MFWGVQKRGGFHSSGGCVWSMSIQGLGRPGREGTSEGRCTAEGGKIVGELPEASEVNYHHSGVVLSLIS